MGNLEAFSVLDSKFDKLAGNQDGFISKTVNLNAELRPHREDVKKSILSYYDKLVAAGLPVPKIAEIQSDEKSFTFVCEYKGLNILQYLESESLGDTLKHPEIYNQIFAVFKKAKENLLYLDPHIKNFVIEEGQVSYVDFTPGWLPEYFDLRLSLASDKEQEILKSFFKCMHYDVLGYHFISDFFKMADENKVFAKEAYAVLKKTDLISGDYDSFFEKVELIKNNELARETENIYLL